MLVRHLLSALLLFGMSSFAAAQQQDGRDVMEILEVDPQAYLIIRKVDDGSRGDLIMPKERSQLPPEKQRELNTSVTNYTHENKERINRWTQKDVSVDQMMQEADRGGWLVVLGLEHYQAIVKGEEAAWEAVFVFKSDKGLVDVEPATQPEKPIDVGEFRRTKESYVERGAHCATDRSDTQPVVPTDKAEFGQIQSLAQAGNSDAEWILGVLYADGLLVPKDNSQAFYWFERSAKQCNKFAQSSLGRSYYYGLGTERDVYKAQFNFLKSAAQGNAMGAMNQGLMLLKPRHDLSGWSAYGESWLAMAMGMGDSFVTSRARAVLVERENNEWEKRARERAERAARSSPSGAGAAGGYDANQRVIDLSFEGLQMLP